uniref:Uncharacterized protein n=1 Tax=viral metagenome TaxID=1070528 RepID=A0A6C0DSR0_9ZZZZ
MIVYIQIDVFLYNFSHTPFLISNADKKLIIF